MVPTTTIPGPRGGVTISRLAIGGNPISGISHQSRARDIAMRDFFTTARIRETLAACEENGITVAFMRTDAHVIRLLAEYWNAGGKIRWFAQTAPEHRSLAENIRRAADNGAAAVYIHGGTAKEFRDAGDWAGYGKQVELIRSLGLSAGSATHQPDFHAARRAAGVDLDFLLQCLYHVDGRRGKIDAQDEKEKFYDADRIPALEAIAASPEPAIAYKVLAAGRKTPAEALPEVARYLKPSDGILMGMCPDQDARMVAENAALVARLLSGKPVPVRA